MDLNALFDYDFTDFVADMTDLGKQHDHRIGRESEQTYVDPYARQKLVNTHPELYRQYIHGWSRSYYSLSRHMEAIFNYATPDIPMSRINFAVYQDCYNEIKNRLSSLPKVRAFDITTQLNEISYKSSTAAGYDYKGTKGPRHGFNYDRAIKRARATIGGIKDGGVPKLYEAIDKMVPDVGYTRTQLTDLHEKTKIRNVWGRAFHYILIEGAIAEPLIKRFSEHDSFYHIGKDPLDSVPQVLSEATGKARWLYAIDWKQFDATVSRYEIETAFSLLQDMLEFPSEESAIAFILSKHLFIHKKIAAPNGETYWVHKGIPSGSYFTSIIGSIVNRLRIEYLWRIIQGRGPAVCYTQGDDSISSDDAFIPPERFAEVANSVGWVMNPDKTEYSTIPAEVTFLGRTMVGGFNMRRIKRCIRLLILPEFPVESGQISAYRARSIADDAGGLSAILNRIADELEADYGVIDEDEVPQHFKRYVL